MRTIAINPVKRRRTVAAKKRKGTKKGMTRKTARKAYAKNPVARRRKSNPKAGITPQELKDLGTAAVGGAAAGALTSYLEDNKPDFLEKVPLEIVSIGAGIALAMFGKTPAMKNVSRGIVSYGAGRLTERMMSEAKNGNGNGNGNGAGDSQTAGLVFANPGHYGSMGYDSPSFNDQLHVGGLVFSMED
jgi:hypothetical protein